MNYRDVINKINSFSNRGIKPGLERIEYLLSKLSNPQDELKIIHIAGTNGKGSVCSMLSSILTSANFKVGLFKSPHIINFRERFQINNKMISEKDICMTFNKICPIIIEMEKNNVLITQFELITAMAVLWFKEQKCDIVILETGLGGRLDSTNVIKNTLISAITSISMDHMNILGNTLPEIAKEKVGIIKENSYVVTTNNQKSQVLDIIKQASIEKNSKLIVVDISNFKKIKSDLNGSLVSYEGNVYHLTLLGNHQIENFSIVVGIIEVMNKLGFSINEKNISNGLQNIFHPARLEILNHNPLIILDGAHNVDGALSVAEFIRENLNNKKIIAIIGMLKDKDYKSCIKILAPLFKMIIFTKIKNNPRALEPVILKNECLNLCNDLIIKENSKKALQFSKEKANVNDVIFICGSLYLSEEIYGG